MIKFAVLGAGWRTEFYIRIANTMPDRFEVVGVLLRSREKGEAFSRKFHVPVYYDYRELMKNELDYVVVCYPWELAFEWNKRLLAENVPFLTETPCAPTLEAVDELWTEYTRHPGAKMQVAEQYFAQPYHRSLKKIVDLGIIGTPSDLLLSMAHGYHGISVMRRLLGVGYEPCYISARRYQQPLQETCGRGGLVYGGKMMTTARDTANFEFASGKVSYFDFSDEQYFSQIRSRFLRLCGTRGEVFQNTVRYISNEGEYVTEKMHRIDLGKYSSHEGYSLRGIMLGSQYLYRSPFEEKTISDQIRLNDEELAIADMMVRMKIYLETGENFYSLAEASQDAYLSHLLTQALETGEPVQSVVKPWAE